MKVVEFAFVAYPAADLTRSAAFYEGVLGLNRGTLINQAGEFWVEYEVGPHTLGLGNEPFLRASGDGPHLVLEVDDFEDTIRHLRQNSVPFAVEPFETPQCRIAVVLDPDGNKLGLHQRKPQPD
jgi:catechol 2,3-dioxygenase-like lactoylglutathione lyase family enzyme